MYKHIYLPGFSNTVRNSLRSTLVLLVVVTATFLFFLSSCKPKSEPVEDPNVYYTCSMDVQVIEHKPGKCPICHMELTPVKKNTAVNSDEILLSQQQILLGNISVDTMHDGNIDDQVVLTATLNFDQMNASSVSSRIMGRVEKLYYRNIGDYIKEGAALYDLYSEELNNAKQEYLLALDKKKTFSAENVIDFDQLLNSAKNKLLLWGMKENQIKDLEISNKITSVTTFYSTASGYITTLDIREGDYVMEGSTIVKLANLSTLWAETQVYTSQISEIDRNSMATVQLPDFDGKEIKGKIEFVNPEINPDTRINLIRVKIPNQDNQLKPGMPAYVILKSPSRKTLTLPIDAVLRDGKSATVWIKTGSHSFKNAMVKTGLESDDRIEIVSGLKEGDIVVITGAYLLNSEYIFKKGSNPMAGHDMSNM